MKARKPEKRLQGDLTTFPNDSRCALKEQYIVTIALMTCMRSETYQGLCVLVLGHFSLFSNSFRYYALKEFIYILFNYISSECTNFDELILRPTDENLNLIGIGCHFQNSH